MRTTADLIKLLSTLDPESPISFTLWTRPPGHRVPPKRIDSATRDVLPQPKTFDSAQQKTIRTRATEGVSYTKIANELKVHRSTVTRYLAREIKASRMAIGSDRKFIIRKGAYDLETGAVVPVEVKP